MHLRKLTARDIRHLADDFGAGSVFERQFGRFGQEEFRGGVAQLSEFDLRAEWKAMSGGEQNGMTVRGHAAVFDRLSLDLGYFRERIAPGAFDAILASAPHVTLNYLHDDAMLLGSTRAFDPGNGGLELRTDDIGLRFYCPVVRDPATGELPSYANDVRIGMQAGIIRQASFCFICGADEWFIDSNDNVTRTVLEVSDLFDVCVCPMGAYPQTDSEVARKLVLGFAQQRTASGSSALDGSHGVEPTAEALEEASAAMQRRLQDADMRRRIVTARALMTSRRG